MSYRYTLLMLVDSNLKRAKVGRNCPKTPPYFRCAGDVICTYTVNLGMRTWPSVEMIKERQYTDIVIALGMNHCKQLNDYGESQGRAISELVGFYQDLRRYVPMARLYYVEVPPSVDSRINANIQRYNRTMCMMLSSIRVTVVTVPEQFYAEDGTLKLEYARPRELLPGFRGQMLHLSDDAQNIYGYAIQRVICRTARKRMR